MLFLNHNNNGTLFAVHISKVSMHRTPIRATGVLARIPQSHGAASSNAMDTVNNLLNVRVTG